MSEESMREIVALIHNALGEEHDVREVHAGPRSNELWFLHIDGREVRLAVRVVPVPI